MLNPELGPRRPLVAAAASGRCAAAGGSGPAAGGKTETERQDVEGERVRENPRWGMTQGRFERKVNRDGFTLNQNQIEINAKRQKRQRLFETESLQNEKRTSFRKERNHKNKDFQKKPPPSSGKKTEKIINLNIEGTKKGR